MQSPWQSLQMRQPGPILKICVCGYQHADTTSWLLLPFLLLLLLLPLQPEGGLEGGAQGGVQAAGRESRCSLAQHPVCVCGRAAGVQ
jgi:hypothetical protein